MPSEERGPPVSEHLAKIVNEKFSIEIDKHKCKTILEKYKIPRNCDSLLVLPVNPEIWSKLPANSKRGDIKMSVLQDSISRVTGSISTTFDSLLKARERKSQIDYKGTSAQLVYCTVLLGHVSQEMSFKHRDSLCLYLSQNLNRHVQEAWNLAKCLLGMTLPRHFRA